MFFTRKKNIVESDFLNGLTDFHSHILPSVDDGIRCMDDALQVLSEYENLGVKKVMFTPHIMEAFSKNNADYLRSEFAKFQSIYDGNIELDLAAEYMLDYEFEKHLHDDNMLTLWDNYLLVETSYILPPMNLEYTLKSIQSKGYYVVLAHPERYGYMREKDLKALKDNGVLFQMNLLSLSGYYGKHAKDRAIYLLENDMYNLIGSDIHNLEVFQNWAKQIMVKPKQLKMLQKIKENICVE